MATRRDILAIGAAATLTPPLRALAPGAWPTIDGAELFADVELYASFGDHQTGSIGERRTSQWMRERLANAGFAVSEQAIDAPFFDPADVYLALSGVPINGLPLHPVTPTESLKAPLALWRDERDTPRLAGAIAVLMLPFARHSALLAKNIQPALQAVVAGQAAGLVLVTDGPTGEAIALNAPPQSPFGARPGMVIGPVAAKPIVAAAMRGEAAELVVRGPVGRRPSSNIVARRSGSGRVVVVTTPVSGWFRCAGERGSGIAAFLALAARLPHLLSEHPLLFAGLAGHELENAGGKRFVSEIAPKPSETLLWVHIGSGFATRDWHDASPLLPLPSADPQRYMIASPEILPVVAKAMGGLAGFERPYPAEARTAAGEAEHILAAGYAPYIGNFGGHRFHHCVADGPETTAPNLLATATIALEKAILRTLGKRGVDPH